MGMVRVIWGKEGYHTGVRHEDEAGLLIPTSSSNATDFTIKAKKIYA
jgi:hypothetical protein